MGETLLEKLRHKEPGIAAAFQNAMAGKKADARLDARGAGLIFRKAIDDHAISSKEAEALVLIIESGVLDDAARTQLLDELGGTDAENAVIKGTAHRLRSAAELAGFNKALELKVVKGITFWSPGTFSHYRPIHYLAIQEMVAAGKIPVFEHQTANLNRYAHLGLGAYDYILHQFDFYQDFQDHLLLIVHEATHAIQDWRNFAAALKFIETDAFIAEAVVKIDLNLDWFPWTHPTKAAVDSDAVKLVLDGKAQNGNAAWKKAYDDVVASVSVEGEYQKIKDSMIDMNEKSGPNQRDEMHKVLEALSKGKPSVKHQYEL
jgi:hypothetical protein